MSQTLSLLPIQNKFDRTKTPVPYDTAPLSELTKTTTKNMSDCSTEKCFLLSSLSN